MEALTAIPATERVRIYRQVAVVILNATGINESRAHTV